MSEATGDFTEATTDITAVEETPAPGNIIQPKGALFILYLIMGVVGIVGNALSITVLARFPQMRKKLANLFLIHQSVIDLLTSVVLIANTLTMKQYYLAGIRGHLFCVVWQSMFLLWGLYSVSTYNFCALSVEQYVSIVHHLRHNSLCSRRNVMLAMVLSWVIGLGSSLYTPLVSGLIGNTCYRLYFWPNTLTRRAVGVLNIVLKFFIPLGLLVYTYGRILVLIMRKISAPVGQQNSSSQPSQFSGAKSNTIKMLTIVCLCFILCWSWNMMYFLLFNLGLPLGIRNPFYQFTVVSVFSNCCVNPFIYATQYKEFRSGMRALFSVFLHRSSQVSPDIVSSNQCHSAG